MPPIFAFALFAVPYQVAEFVDNEFLDSAVAAITPGSWSYALVFIFFMFLFSYFYTSLVFDPTEVADNLKKNGGFIPTVRPGKQTAEFLYGVANRLTFWGAIYLSYVLCLSTYMKL